MLPHNQLSIPFVQVTGDVRLERPLPSIANTIRGEPAALR